MELIGHFFRLCRVRVLTRLIMAGVLPWLVRVRVFTGLSMTGVFPGLGRVRVLHWAEYG